MSIEFSDRIFVKVDIAISQAHLGAGVPGQECGCALALAIEDRFPGSCPSVGYHSVVCRPKGQRVVIHLTAIAVDFVADFDHRRRLAPLSVPVEISPESLAILESTDASQ